MRVLVACEYSGIVRDAFLDAGHDAISCDLEPTESPGPHIVGDVRPLLRESWDLVIAHPPCTTLSRVSLQWLYKRADRWCQLCRDAELFRDCLKANAKRICVENPRMHRHATKRIGGPPDQYVHPWQHGHPFMKITGLHLRGLPNLRPTQFMPNPKEWLPYVRSDAERGKQRARFWPGIAAAMADQWGSIPADAPVFAAPYRDNLPLF